MRRINKCALALCLFSLFKTSDIRMDDPRAGWRLWSSVASLGIVSVAPGPPGPLEHSRSSVSVRRPSPPLRRAPPSDASFAWGSNCPSRVWTAWSRRRVRESVCGFVAQDKAEAPASSQADRGAPLSVHGCVECPSERDGFSTTQNSHMCSSLSGAGLAASVVLLCASVSQRLWVLNVASERQTSGSDVKQRQSRLLVTTTQFSALGRRKRPAAPK